MCYTVVVVQTWRGEGNGCGFTSRRSGLCSLRDQVTFGRVTKTGQRKCTSQKRYDPCLVLLSGEGNCFQEELTHLPLLISHGEWMPFLQYCLLHTGVKGLRNLNHIYYTHKCIFTNSQLTCNSC